jgi:hypothetical protein
VTWAIAPQVATVPENIGALIDAGLIASRRLLARINQGYSNFYYKEFIDFTSSLT